MVTQQKKQIIPYQLFFILIQVQIGVSVVTLPHDVFLTAKGDGWISVLLTGIIIQCMIFIYIQLMSRFPSHTWVEVVNQLFGKFFGKVIIILYVFYFMFLASMTLGKYALLLSAWMMPRTPSWILLSLIIIIVLYIATANIETIAQFYVLASLILLIYIGFSVYALKDANITFILPIGASGTNGILKGIITVLPSFAGLELLFLLYPHTNAKKRQLFKVATYSNIFMTTFYAFIVLTALLYLSPEELILVPEPVLYVVKSFTFRIIERPDLIFTSIWIVLVATTLTIFIYASKMLVRGLCSKCKNFIVILILLLICSTAAIPLRKTYTLQSVSAYTPYIVIAYMVVLPILLYIVSVIFSKRGDDA